MSEDRTGLIATIGALVGVPLLIGTLVLYPRCVGADRWSEGTWSPLRWSLDEFEALDFDGRPKLLIADASLKRNGKPASRQVHRLTLVDRTTGEIDGRHDDFAEWEPVSVRAGRLWTRQWEDDWRAFSLPDLEPIADLEDLIDAHSELSWEDVQSVAMPEDTETVRLLARDGFLWDLQPDLQTLVRLHHDTPIPDTPRFGDATVRCDASPIEVPSGRQALLGTHSRRPALRVADAPHALEAQEVDTPHQGFLDGVFLCGTWHAPITRPPEDVFIWHTREHDGASEVRISRVSLSEGLRWTRGETEWLGGTTDDDSTLVWAEDRGEGLLLWLVRTRGDETTGYHFLVDVDVATGEARWVRPL